MPIQSISIGPATPILQNVVYALPAKASVLTTSVACEVSLDGSVWTAFTSGGITGAKFVRCTTGNATVVCSNMSSGGGASVTIPANLAVANSVSIGPTPSTTGMLRLSNNGDIKVRMVAADRTMMKWDDANFIEIGDGVANFFALLKGNLIINPGVVLVNDPNNAMIQMVTRAADPTITTGNGALFFRNIAGKIALMAKFPTGAAVQVAIEA